jgi:alkanesulfonate monooxygenase SsuD/methylene tetrahydromethanopterin reductase-like flavin-dependent oxidoreductase (luciferase family)
MRIGLINELHGRPATDKHPTWKSLRERARAAEAVGFDIFVFEDALMYRGEDQTDGVWESVAIAGALAATTETIDISHSVVNSVYRSPAMMASIAETLHEISAGRYVLGIGAGNTPDSDYKGFGFPTDLRYSRFEEAINIIHTLLKTGQVDFDGQFYTAEDAELVLRGPGGSGPPINVAAGGAKMLRLAARYGDAWNWWVWGEAFEAAHERLSPILEALDIASAGSDRSSGPLWKTLDYYTVVPDGFEDEVPNMDQPLRGTSAVIAEELLKFSAIGIDEIRCDVYPRTVDAIEAMRPVVELVHDG